MPRPSQNLDRKLLEAGKALIEEQGLARLSLRAVARRAGVNLGMFHYHFKGKQDFVRQVLQATYEEFFAGFSLEVEKGADPLESLKFGLTRLARFSRDQRRLALAMLADAAAGRPEPLAFAKANVPRHLKVVLRLLRECQKKGLLLKCPLPVALPILMGAAALPGIGMGMLERVQGKGALGLALPLLRRSLLSDKAIEQRLHFALRGLSPERSPR